MQSNKKIVILGAGFAGIYSALSISKECGKNVSVKIINNSNYFLFTPMLHEVATGGLGQNQVVESIREISHNKNIDFLEAEIESVDLEKREVVTNKGNEKYDILIVAIGAKTNFFGTPGAEENSFALKNLSDAISLRKEIIQSFEKASNEKDKDLRAKYLSFAVVGGGATGVESVAEISEFCNHTLRKYYKNTLSCGDISISLINSGAELLPVFSEKTRSYALKILQKKRIKVLLNSRVKEVNKDGVVFDTGEVVKAGTVVWTAGVIANQIKTTGGELLKDKSGRIMTDEKFAVTGFSDIYALGDVANVKESSGRGYPLLAQVAVLEGGLIGKNIANQIAGKNMSSFGFKSRGELISLGKWEAAGTILGMNINGKLAWFMWRTIYLFKFISNSKKWKIALDWTLHIFFSRDVSVS